MSTERLGGPIEYANTENRERGGLITRQKINPPTPQDFREYYEKNCRPSYFGEPEPVEPAIDPDGAAFRKPL